MDDRAESAQSARFYNGQFDQLHRALRRKQELLQRLKEQHMLDDPHRPHTWGGSQRQSHFLMGPHLPPPLPLYQPVPVPSSLLLPPPGITQIPHIIQQTLPQQPATIIQQLPQTQPLVSQIPPPLAHPAPRSGSIKEDMVELMLMQNAQMHQIIMHNMMLKAMPAIAMTPPGGPSHCFLPSVYQDSHQSNPVHIRPDAKPQGSAVHHHHHYGPSLTAPPLPPIGHPIWPAGMPSVSTGQAGGHLPSIHHVIAPFTFPPLNP